MRPMFLIAWRSFVQHATSRAFIIGLLLMPIYMLIGGYFPSVTQVSAQSPLAQATQRHFGVLDETGKMTDVVDAALERDNAKRTFAALVEYAEENADEERMEAKDHDLYELLFSGDPDTPKAFAAYQKIGGSAGVFQALQPYLESGAPVFNTPKPRFVRVDLPPEILKAEDPIEAARPYLTGEMLVRGPTKNVNLWALLVIPKDFLSGEVQAQYYADDITRLGLHDFLKDALGEELRRRRVEQLGLNQTVAIEALETTADVAPIDPNAETKTTPPTAQFQAIGPMFVYLMLFLSVFMTANMVVMAMVEEKSNRVAELLLSCVRAESLMAGKLIAGLMLSLLLVAVWMVSASLSVAWLYPDATSIVASFFKSLTSGFQIFLLLAFFALSYLTVAAFYLAAGSAATSITDAQAIVAPATMLTLPVFLLPIAIAFDPDGTIARVASYVPLVSPFVMMLRSMGDPSVLDVVGALCVGLLTLIWLIRLVARVFRTNLLRPDATPSFVAFMRDLFTAKET